MRELELNDRVTVRLDGGRGRTAIVLPGYVGGCFQPLLRYATLVLQARGWSTALVEWRPLRDGAWVIEQLRAVLDHVEDERPLVVAKSLATRALPLAVERGLPGVWLTPLLQLPDVAAALERAEAPTLLVGGSADESWDGQVAARLPVERFVVEGGDHGLELPDPFASLDALRRVTERVDAFVRGL